VKVLLDENFPLALLRRLQADGLHAEHIIPLGWRGASDQRIRQELVDPDLLFLTHDEDFLFDKPVAAVIVLSRVRQSRRLQERVEVWLRAIRELGQNLRPERRFELLDDGRLLPWEQGPGNSWIAKRPRPSGETPDDDR
jgi:predicted nuclease of predicted toxin-antitoxin system